VGRRYGLNQETGEILSELAGTRSLKSSQTAIRFRWRAEMGLDATFHPLYFLKNSHSVAPIPFVIAVIALFASRTMRTINAASPSPWLIGIQTYRVAGIMFIFPFLTYGIIPAGFAWPAESAIHLRES
jgi:hypothetical protein